MNLSKLIAEKKKKQARKAKMNTAKNLTIGALVGVAAGAVTGVLLAPKSGKETREDLKNKSAEINNNIKTKASEIKSSTVSNISEAKSRINEYLENKRADKMEEKSIDTISEAVQAELSSDPNIEA